MNAEQRGSFAKALAAAFAADLTIPEVAGVVRNGGLTREQFTRIVLRDVDRGLRGVPGPALMPSVRAFVRQNVNLETFKRVRAAGLSAEASYDVSMIGGISSVVGALAGAVGAIWSTKINTDAQKNLAQLQLQSSQITQNSQALAAKSALINNATANGALVNSAGEVVGPLGSFSMDTGLPVIALGTAALATIVGGWYALSN